MIPNFPTWNKTNCKIIKVAKTEDRKFFGVSTRYYKYFVDYSISGKTYQKITHDDSNTNYKDDQIVECVYSNRNNEVIRLIKPSIYLEYAISTLVIGVVIISSIIVLILGVFYGIFLILIILNDEKINDLMVAWFACSLLVLHFIIAIVK